MGKVGNRLLGLLALAAFLVITVGSSPAEAGWRSHSCYSCCCATSFVVPYEPVVLVQPIPWATRQCRGVYFDTGYSAWFEVDVMVPYKVAQIGLSYVAEVPHVGYVRVWIKKVFKIPQVGPPEFDKEPA